MFVLVLVMGSSFQKEADAIATAQTALLKPIQRDAEPGWPAGPLPRFTSAEREISCHGLQRGPRGQRQYLHLPAPWLRLRRYSKYDRFFTVQTHRDR